MGTRSRVTFWLALAHVAAHTLALAQERTPLSADELYGFLVQNLPTMTGAEDFFKELDADPALRAHYNRLIAETPALRKVAEQGLAYRTQFNATEQESAPPAVREQLWELWTNPWREARASLNRWNHSRQVQGERLKNKLEARNDATQEVIKRYGVTGAESRAEIEARDLLYEDIQRHSQRRLTKAEQETVVSSRPATDHRPWVERFTQYLRAAQNAAWETVLRISADKAQSRHFPLSVDGGRTITWNDLRQARVVRSSTPEGTHDLKLPQFRLFQTLFNLNPISPTSMRVLRYLLQSPGRGQSMFLRNHVHMAYSRSAPDAGRFEVILRDRTPLTIYVRDGKTPGIGIYPGHVQIAKPEYKPWGTLEQEVTFGLYHRVHQLEELREKLSSTLKTKGRIDGKVLLKTIRTSEAQNKTQIINLDGLSRTANEADLVGGLRWWGYRYAWNEWSVRDQLSAKSKKTHFTEVEQMIEAERRWQLNKPSAYARRLHDRVMRLPRWVLLSAALGGLAAGVDAVMDEVEQIKNQPKESALRAEYRDEGPNKAIWGVSQSGRDQRIRTYARDGNLYFDVSDIAPALSEPVVFGDSHRVPGETGEGFYLRSYPSSIVFDSPEQTFPIPKLLGTNSIQIRTEPRRIGAGILKENRLWFDRSHLEPTWLFAPGDGSAGGPPFGTSYPLKWEGQLEVLGSLPPDGQKYWQKNDALVATLVIPAQKLREIGAELDEQGFEKLAKRFYEGKAANPEDIARWIREEGRLLSQRGALPKDFSTRATSLADLSAYVDSACRTQGNCEYHNVLLREILKKAFDGTPWEPKNVGTFLIPADGDLVIRVGDYSERTELVNRVTGERVHFDATPYATEKERIQRTPKPPPTMSDGDPSRRFFARPPLYAREEDTVLRIAQVLAGPETSSTLDTGGPVPGGPAPPIPSEETLRWDAALKADEVAIKKLGLEALKTPAGSTAYFPHQKMRKALQVLRNMRMGVLSRDEGLGQLQTIYPDLTRGIAGLEDAFASDIAKLQQQAEAITRRKGPLPGDLSLTEARQRGNEALIQKLASTYDSDVYLGLTKSHAEFIRRETASHGMLPIPDDNQLLRIRAAIRSLCR